jgi:hypothetical protein
MGAGVLRGTSLSVIHMPVIVQPLEACGQPAVSPVGGHRSLLTAVAVRPVGCQGVTVRPPDPAAGRSSSCPARAEPPNHYTYSSSAKAESRSSTAPHSPGI